MGESQIKFGDKFFLCGQFLRYLDNFEEYEPNSLDNTHGYVVEIMSAPSFASITPFFQVEMVDVTDELSIRLPLPAGTKVWMPK